MIKGYKDAITRAFLIAVVLYIPHFIKNAIVSYYNLQEMFRLPADLRIFNKIVVFKVLVILLILFFLYNRDLLSRLKFNKLSIMRLAGFAALSYISIFSYYLWQIYAVKTGSGLNIYRLGQFAPLIIYLVFAVLGIFDKKTLKRIYRRTYPQAWIFLAALSAGTAGLILFESAWPYFSGLISYILLRIFSLAYPVSLSLNDAGPILNIDGFIISIGSPCSGIDSMLLFFIFFAAIFAMDHKKVYKLRFIMLALAGLIGTYLVNILRLLILILVGVHISPEIAVGLFHTNAGWLFFVIYFLLYYGIIRKHIYRTRSKAPNPKQ